MAKLYYAKYDVFVDSQNGVIYDLCICVPDECSFKKAWSEDGSPVKLSEEVLGQLNEANTPDETKHM